VPGYRASGLAPPPKKLLSHAHDVKFVNKRRLELDAFLQGLLQVGRAQRPCQLPQRLKQPAHSSPAGLCPAAAHSLQSSLLTSATLARLLGSATRPLCNLLTTPLPCRAPLCAALQAPELACHAELCAFLSSGSDTYACSDEPPLGVGSRHASTSSAQPSRSSALLAGIAHLPGAVDAVGKGGSRSSSAPGTPDRGSKAECTQQQQQQQPASYVQQQQQQPASPSSPQQLSQQQAQPQQQPDSPAKAVLLGGSLAKGYQSIAQSLASLGAGVAQLAGVNASSTAASSSTHPQLRTTLTAASPDGSPSESPSVQQAQQLQQKAQPMPATASVTALATATATTARAAAAAGSTTAQMQPDGPPCRRQADGWAAVATSTGPASSVASAALHQLESQTAQAAAVAAAAAAADFYSEATGGLTGPLYQLIDTVFELQLRGFFRRQVRCLGPPHACKLCAP
jgi:hypothetical protein